MVDGHRVIVITEPRRRRLYLDPERHGERVRLVRLQALQQGQLPSWSAPGLWVAPDAGALLRAPLSGLQRHPVFAPARALARHHAEAEAAGRPRGASR